MDFFSFLKTFFFNFQVIYVSNPDLNNSIRYQEQLRSQGNHNPYPQPVHPRQVPQVQQPAIMGFNPGLAAAINNFGLNILRKPNPFELPGPQGNPNPLMQQIHRPEMGHRPFVSQQPLPHPVTPNDIMHEYMLRQEERERVRFQQTIHPM